MLVIGEDICFLYFYSLFFTIKSLCFKDVYLYLSEDICLPSIINDKRAKSFGIPSC